MPPFNPLFASLNFTHASTFLDGVKDFAAERSPVVSLASYSFTDTSGWLSQVWQSINTFLLRPDVYPALITWAVTFTLMMIILFSLGFGPAGVVGGSLAAGFQSWAYGAFTPGAAIFATLTSLGMLGLLAPLFFAISAGVATFVSLIVWIILGAT